MKFKLYFGLKKRETLKDKMITQSKLYHVHVLLLVTIKFNLILYKLKSKIQYATTMKRHTTKHENDTVT